MVSSALSKKGIIILTQGEKKNDDDVAGPDGTGTPTEESYL